MEIPRETAAHPTLVLDFASRTGGKNNVSVALSPQFMVLLWWPHLHGHLVREGLRSLRDTTMESDRTYMEYRALCYPLGQVQEGSVTEPAPSQTALITRPLFPSHLSTFQGCA